MALDNGAILNFYDRRRVTRAQFEKFQTEPTTLLAESPQAHEMLKKLEHTEELLKLGEGLCRIDIKGEPTGTGFHLGGGWVMTNQHVICEWDEETSSACCASFHFPGFDVEAKSRRVLFSHFTDPEGTQPHEESRKDLALVYLEEVSNRNIPALNKIFQRPAKNGERAYLIHYGDGTEEKPPPQQFSIYENEVFFSIEKKEHQILVHSAHSRPGSSGAPLLVYDDHEGFVVAGVHFAAGSLSAAEYKLDSPGLALVFCGKNWLRNTLGPVYLIHRLGLMKNPTWAITVTQPNECLGEVCSLLQCYLDKLSLRAVIPIDPPEGVVSEVYPNIIWKPKCNHSQH